MKYPASEFSDWANLPVLVLHLISEKVDFITDYVRYRAVCSSWRFASHPKPHHLPPQLPWLFFPGPATHVEDDGARYFFDFWQPKDHKIHVPETIDNTCLATCRGWLFFAAHGGKEIFLLNPLTRDRVQLPPFTTPFKIIGAHHQDSESIFCSVFNFRTNYPCTKLSFSTNPTEPNCLIMLSVSYCPRISYCQVRDYFWTEVDLFPVVSANLEDVAYSNGRFYLLENRLISIYDLNTHKVLGTYLFESEFRPDDKFFLEGKSGVYVIAIHETEERGEEAEEGTEKDLRQKIELYQVQKQNIADNRDSLDRCCIYLKYMEYVRFVCTASTDNDGNGTYRSSILSVKMDDGKSEVVATGFGKKLPCWRPLRVSSQSAMWFQPSFV